MELIYFTVGLQEIFDHLRYFYLEYHELPNTVDRMLSCLNGIVAKALKLGMGVALWTTSEIVKVLIASNIQTTSSNIAKMFV